MEGRTYERSPNVAVVYDELVRRKLAEHSQKNAPGFDPNKNCHLVDDVLLKRATKVYDERGEQLRTKGQGKGASGNSNWNNWNGKGSSRPTGDERKGGGKRTYPWESTHYAKKTKWTKGSKGGDILSLSFGTKGI